ncbi:MAG: hypothetical protein M3331_00235, partial [Actinomycetota bacterium]|nr:hypothetical protein [Actinomycetota bacterium]
MSEAKKTDKTAEEGAKPLRLTLPWLIKGAIGLAGLAIYVQLVGGAVLWARFNSANIPELQTIEVLSPEYLLAVGASSLFVPLLVGAAAATLQYILAPSNPRGTLPGRFGFVLLVVVLFAIYMAVWGAAGLDSFARGALVVVALAGAWGVWAVASRSGGFLSLALIFFVFGALYGACFKIVREFSVTPRFDLAVVFRGEERRPLAGLYMGRT